VFVDFLAASLPIGGILGVALVGYALVMAAGVAKQPATPSWAPVFAWCMVALGVLVHLTLLILILSPGLVELP
jgi:hypothetical protein